MKLHAKRWLSGVGLAVGLVAAGTGTAWMQEQRAQDGKALSGESAATQDLFRATWAEQAEGRWVIEHNEELARLAPRAMPTSVVVEPLTGAPPPETTQAPPPAGSPSNTRTEATPTPGRPDSATSTAATPTAPSASAAATATLARTGIATPGRTTEVVTPTVIVGEAPRP
jgi:hypothetical protein